MQADEASSSTSFPLPVVVCWNRRCERSAKYYFECSRTGCPGPPIPPELEVVPNKRIALCHACAHKGHCPFCSSSVQQEDLHSVTDRPATLTSADQDRRPPDGPAASGISGYVDYQTLDQFNKHFEELANKVQKNMRALTQELGINASDRPEILELVKEAQEIFNSLTQQGLQADRNTYRWLISLYARAKDQEQVEAWAHKMERSGNCSTEAYNSVIFVFAVPQGVDRADMWFHRMLQNDCIPDVKSYNILIQACARSRDYTRANLYLERMQVARLEPDSWTFGHLIRACANEDQNPSSLKKAEGFWKEMQQCGVKPNDFTSKAMLQACANAGSIDKASYYFKESVKAGLVLDVVTFTTMISAFKKSGNVAGAEEWFSKMQAAEVRPNVVAYNCVVRVCGAAGDETNACKWLEKLEAAGHLPSQHTFEALIICALNRKDFSQVDVWLQRMLDAGVTQSISTFHILLQACERAGNLRQAERWFNAMAIAGVQPDVHAYNSMLITSAVYDSSGWLGVRRKPGEEQRKWFFKMTSSGVQPNVATHEILTHSAFSSSPAVIVIGCLAVGSLLFWLCRKSATL